MDIRNTTALTLRHGRLRKRVKRARHRVGLALALVGLMSAATLATGPMRPVSAQEKAPSWSVTGSLNVPRSGHSATLLSDGRVLVVSGWSNTNSAGELYDPLTGTWNFTGSLNVPRTSYTTTLLNDGKVLIVGGYSAPDTLASAELYDPDTGRWSFTGSLNTPRAYHTATLLQNGKVLVAGGGDEKGVHRTVELYDPGTGLWSFTGDLNAPLYLHKATLLQNGRVLAAGGDHPELYDPDTGTWSIVGDIDGEYRIDHTVTLLLDGRVLIAGGINDSNSNQVGLDTAEVYNPDTGQWSRTGRLNSTRNGHTATLLPDGKVLILGGHPLGSSELYDPEKGTWKFTSNPNTRRGNHSATLLADGKVLIVGGFTLSPVNASILGSAEVGHNFSEVPPTITMASLAGKKLIVRGEYFALGAVILVNGKERHTVNDFESPHTTLTSKKAGRKMKAGDRVQVRNPDGTISAEFTFTAPEAARPADAINTIRQIP